MSSSSSKKQKFEEKKKNLNDTSELEVYLKALVTSLHTKLPDHPIFGAASKNIIQLPYEQTNGQCWLGVMKLIASEQTKNGVKLGENKCWMSKQNTVKIFIYENGKQVLAKSILRCRLLAFFKSPTTENWEILQNKNNDNKNQFDHFCGRGLDLKEEQNGNVCINGIEHGEFSTRAVNESRKLCKNGAYALCPGHGPKKGKCIFTNPDGTLRKCRMQLDQVPICECPQRCYPL
jgi:hypothetical protein